MVSLAHPWALLLAVPILAFLAWPKALRVPWPALAPAGLPGDWRRVVEPPLRAALRGPDLESDRRRGGILVPVLWLLLVLALAGPGIETGERRDFANLAGRVIVLDLGGAADIADQRLVARRLLDRSPGVPTAIVAATGDAFDVIPLTTDRQAIERYLQVIDAGLMPVGGRALPLAFAHAEEVLTRASIIAGQVVLVTGGAAPAVQDRGTSAWSHAIVIAGPGLESWRPFAESVDARLVDAEGLTAVETDLARDLARAAREAGERIRVDLSAWIMALAALLWLGLFRRRLDA